MILLLNWIREPSSCSIESYSEKSVTVTTTVYPILDENGKYIGATDDPTGFDIDRPIAVSSSSENEPVCWTTMRNYSDGVSPTAVSSANSQFQSDSLQRATTYYSVGVGQVPLSQDI